MLLVFLFVPYKSVHVKYKLNSYSLLNYKTTAHKSGYMFVLKYLKLKSNEIANPEKSVPGTDYDSYVLNKTLFLIELIIVIVLAPMDYILFCLVLRKRKHRLD